MTSSAFSRSQSITLLRSPSLLVPGSLFILSPLHARAQLRTPRRADFQAPLKVWEACLCSGRSPVGGFWFQRLGSLPTGGRVGAPVSKQAAAVSPPSRRQSSGLHELMCAAPRGSRLPVLSVYEGRKQRLCGYSWEAGKVSTLF